MTSFADVNFPLVILKDGGFDTAYDDSRESWEVQERIQLADSGDQERDNEQFYNNEQCYCWGILVTSYGAGYLAHR